MGQAVFDERSNDWDRDVETATEHGHDCTKHRLHVEKSALPCINAASLESMGLC